MRKIFILFVFLISLNIYSKELSGEVNLGIKLDENLSQVSQVDLKYKELIKITTKLKYEGKLREGMNLKQDETYIQASLNLGNFGKFHTRYTYEK